MTFLVELVIALAILIGSVFTLVGSYGLVKLNRPMPRLHAPTKASTLGVGSILIASLIYTFLQGSGALGELLIMAFLFVTAPVTGYLISKVMIHRGQNTQELPAPSADDAWSTVAPEEKEGLPS